MWKVVIGWKCMPNMKSLFLTVPSLRPRFQFFHKGQKLDGPYFDIWHYEQPVVTFHLGIPWRITGLPQVLILVSTSHTPYDVINVPLDDVHQPPANRKCRMFIGAMDISLSSFTAYFVFRQSYPYVALCFSDTTKIVFILVELQRTLVAYGMGAQQQVMIINPIQSKLSLHLAEINIRLKTSELYLASHCML